ncbi:hypothetical protein P7K49_002376, partial [Saguinus oedipus]
HNWNHHLQTQPLNHSEKFRNAPSKQFLPRTVTAEPSWVLDVCAKATLKQQGVAKK